MRFIHLKLKTHKLAEERNFYVGTLGCSMTDQTANSFTVQVGWSKLTFEREDRQHFYHYCFLIPQNKLFEALNWMEERAEIIDEGELGKVHHFDSWNADSFYFYDASGNVVEFIVRHDLNNPSSGAFDSEVILGLNEIGLPTRNIAVTNRLLQKQMGSSFWKGDTEYFGTHGTQEGLILLPNFDKKSHWYPTELKITPEPFILELEHLGHRYVLDYRNEKLAIHPWK